jgi:hypothetical protein
MKKFVLLCLIFSWGAISIEAKAPPKTADFTGNWILDMSQTKKVPDGLDTYSMVIKQDARQLNVQTKLQGNLRPDSSPTATSPQTRARVGPPGGYPGGVGPMGGPGMPVGGIGGPEEPVGGGGTIGGQGVPVGPEGPIGGPAMPVGGVGPMSGPGIPVGGGPMGEGIPGSTEPSRGRIGRNNRHARTAAQAFTLYPRSAVYKLDGSETNVQLGDPTHSEATSKAAWTKGHKELKLSLAGGDSSARNGDGVAVKEQWKLSKDGQHLLIDRTVHTPGRSTTIHLVFNKQPAASGQSGS